MNPAPGLPSATRSLLVDARTGIVRALVDASTRPSFPPEFRLMHSYVCDSTRFSQWTSDSAGAGYGFDGAVPADPTAAAVGEAVERYCGNIVAKPIVRARASDLDGPTVDLSSLARFGESQYAAPGFPFVEPTTDRVLDWTPGTDVLSGRAIWVPAELVWGSYPLDVARRGPAISPVAQAGLAAGPDREFALQNALREIVERDAMTTAWTGRGTIWTVTDLPERLSTLGRGVQDSAGRDTLTTRWIAFGNEFGLPVLGALVRDHDSGYLAMGTASHEDASTAATKALGEALQLQLLLGDYDNPESGIGRASTAPGSPLRPWRSDRRYSDSYRSDFADVMDYGCHLQLHLDPRIQELFESELAAATVGEVSLDSLSSDRTVLDAVTSAGFHPTLVDLTTSDVALTGLCVVRVVVAGCLTNAAAGLPFLGSPRLQEQLAGRPPRVLPLPH